MQPPQGQPPQQHYPPQTPSVAPNPAQTAGIVLLVCAVVMAIGMFTNGWATAREGRDSVNAGLFDIEGCGGGHCQSLGWERGAKRLDIPSDVNTFRNLGMLGGFAALGVIIAAGVMALGRNTAKIPLKAFEIPMGIAGFCLTTFAFRLAMADHDVNFGPSYSAFLTIGALIVAGVVLHHKLKPMIALAQAATVHPTMGQPQQPMQQQPMQQQPMQQQNASTCSTCGNALQFAEQYQRWYCGSCQQYI